MRFDNKIKGFGTAIFTWLFFVIIYDGIFLMLLLLFKDYPLENLSIALIIFNPIDLARILILLELDISTMMGYTGAVLQQFLGSAKGSFFIMGILAMWIIFPFCRMILLAKKKDF
jgi:Cu-processing system permease protein